MTAWSFCAIWVEAVGQPLNSAAPNHHDQGRGLHANRSCLLGGEDPMLLKCKFVDGVVGVVGFHQAV